MDYSRRGHIQYFQRAKQVVKFDGLQYGNITPTDVDGLIEIHNIGFAFFELKLRGAELPTGQKTALTRIVDGLYQAKKEAVLFVAYHDVEDAHKPIIAKDAECVRMYYEHKWYEVDGQTLEEMTDRFVRFALDKERDNNRKYEVARNED